MDVAITEFTVTETSMYAQATCGKVSAIVTTNEWEVRVICQNESHKVWRGSGRAFKTFEEAIGAYKKPEMKAIIQAIEHHNKLGTPTVRVEVQVCDIGIGGWVAFLFAEDGTLIVDTDYEPVTYYKTQALARLEAKVLEKHPKLLDAVRKEIARMVAS